MKKNKILVSMAGILAFVLLSAEGCGGGSNETPPPAPAPPAPAPGGGGGGCANDCPGNEYYEFLVMASVVSGQKQQVVTVTTDETGVAKPVKFTTPVTESRKIKYNPARDIVLRLEVQVLPPVPGFSQCRIVKHGGAEDGKILDYEMNGSKLQNLSCIKEKGH
jgi:hypothetical protein